MRVNNLLTLKLNGRGSNPRFNLFVAHGPKRNIKAGFTRGLDVILIYRGCLCLIDVWRAHVCD